MKNIYLSFSFAFTTCFLFGQNVGIGTATPQNKLEVFGSFGIKRSETGAAIWFNSGTDANHVLWNDYHGGPITKGLAGSGFDGIKWNTFKGIQFKTGTAGATDRLSILHDENYINLLNSNVGIGNATPRVKLSLGESIPSGQQYVYMRIYGNEPGSWKGGAAFGYTSASVIMGELNGVAQIGGHTSNLGAWSDLAINSGGGNVGIGTVSPQARFHVNGSVRFENLSVGSQSTALMMDASGNISSRALNISNWDAAYSWGNHANAGYLTSFSETDPTWNGTANANSDISRSGNVGIGIAANANVKLNLSGELAMNDTDIHLRGATDENHLLGYRNAFASASMDGPLLMGHASGALGTNLGGDKIALFWNNSAKVGIGTTNPAGKLHVATSSSDGNVGSWTDGQFVVGKPDASGANSGAIGLSYNTSDNTASIAALSPATAWRDLRLRANDIVFMNGNTERARMSAGGNFGIGTSASHRLHVAGNNNAMRIEGTGSFGSSGKLNFGDVNYVYLEETVDDHLTIHASSGVRMGNTGTYTKGMHHGTINVGDNNANACGQCAWSGWSGDVLEIQVYWSTLGIPDGTNKTVMLTADGNNNSYNDNWSASLQQMHSNRMDILIDRVDGSGWGLTTLRLHYIVMNNN